LSSSTYYDNIKRDEEKQTGTNNPEGRPIPGYSYDINGNKVFDEQIKEWLTELVAGDGYPYGYRKLTVCLREDYMLKINKKKVYRLCDELDILKPQRQRKRNRPQRTAKREEVNGSNQLWEMDVKYGYIAGIDQFFFQMSILDVFDKSIISYHLGLSCKAKDACRILKKAMKKRNLGDKNDLPVIRTDNGPQFIAHDFADTCNDLGLRHQRIPVKTPNMNAHIESFHATLEKDCYERYEFSSFIEVYEVVSQYIKYYNNRYRHGSIGDIPPNEYYRKYKQKQMVADSFIA